MDPNATQATSPFATPKASLQTTETQEYDSSSIFSPKGRFGRIDYLIYSIGFGMLFSLVSTVITGAVSAFSPNAGIAVYFLMVIPMLVVGVIFMIRRLHDMDWTGWWSITYFVPLINVIIFLIIMFAPGTDGSNRYGLPRPPPSQLKVVLTIVFAVLCTLSVLGIFAAIAIPAYQDYVMRAQGG